MRHLEADRGNHVRTRNQRLAAIHTLFDYIATCSPEMLAVCQRVTAIPMKRAAPAQTRFLERDEDRGAAPTDCRRSGAALRDRTLLLFLYNTGARAQEVADLRVGHLDLGEKPRVHLHGKGDKWRTCPLWRQTAGLLRTSPARPPRQIEAPVFSQSGMLTRSGIYKIVRRHAASLTAPPTGRRVSPHAFRHTAAVHLLEAGVEINVIRGWLGHADLATTNRYAEINTNAKLAALRDTEPPGSSRDPHHARLALRSDAARLALLALTVMCPEPPPPGRSPRPDRPASPRLPFPGT